MIGEILRKPKQLALLVAIGGVGTSIDYVLLYGLLQVGLSLFVASSLGYLAGTGSIYALLTIAFLPAEERRFRWSVFLGFILVGLLGLVINFMLLILLLGTGTKLWLAKAVAVMVVFVVNSFLRLSLLSRKNG